MYTSRGWRGMEGHAEPCGAMRRGRGGRGEEGRKGARKQKYLEVILRGKAKVFLSRVECMSLMSAAWMCEWSGRMGVMACRVELDRDV